MKKLQKILALQAMVIGGMNMDFGEKKIAKRTVNTDNPHNFSRFETDGFVTYSYNQQAHDDKYAAYLKRKNK